MAPQGPLEIRRPSVNGSLQMVVAQAMQERLLLLTRARVASATWGRAAQVVDVRRRAPRQLAVEVPSWVLVEGPAAQASRPATQTEQQRSVEAVAPVAAQPLRAAQLARVALLDSQEQALPTPTNPLVEPEAVAAHRLVLVTD